MGDLGGQWGCSAGKVPKTEFSLFETRVAIGGGGFFSFILHMDQKTLNSRKGRGSMQGERGGVRAVYTYLHTQRGESFWGLENISCCW